MDGNTYEPVMGENGLSEFQRDYLLLGLNQNLTEVKKKVNEHDKEIFGHENYRGTKAKSHDSPCPAVKRVSNRLWWLIGMLITTGVIGGGVVSQSLGG